MDRPSWFYRQSGAIPFKIRNGKLMVLLITSRKAGKWIIPKGIVELHLSSADSASKEAFEEAGVEGDILEPCLGSFEYAKWKGRCRVEVFALQVTETLQDWPDVFIRERRWYPFDIAILKLNKRNLRDIISGLPDYLRKRDFEFS